MFSTTACMYSYYLDEITEGWMYSAKKMKFFLLQDYISLIKGLPEEDDPSYFGLPSNIERSWQRIVSSQVIGQLKGG